MARYASPNRGPDLRWNGGAEFPGDIDNPAGIARQWRDTGQAATAGGQIRSRRPAHHTENRGICA